MANILETVHLNQIDLASALAIFEAIMNRQLSFATSIALNELAG